MLGGSVDEREIEEPDEPTANGCVCRNGMPAGTTASAISSACYAEPCCARRLAPMFDFGF
jgi:hypothetical protein